MLSSAQVSNYLDPLGITLKTDLDVALKTFLRIDTQFLLMIFLPWAATTGKAPHLPSGLWTDGEVHDVS